MSRDWRGLLLAAACLMAFDALAERRVALVIGNGGYSYARLDNPVSDATDVANKLSTLGFAVKLVPDADYETLKTRIVAWGEQLKPGDVALFYYAGHAVVSTDKKDYLIPIGEKIPDEVQLEFRAVNVEEVLRYMNEHKAAVKIVILDSCRDNPFHWGRGEGKPRGLVRPKGGAGSLIAFAAELGETADDAAGGNGRNSPYTTQLLSYLDQPGLDVRTMFDEVGRAVAKATGGKQNPENTASVLPKNFCLAGCKPELVADRDDAKPTIEPQPVVPPPPPDQPKTGEVIHDRLADGSPGPAMVFIGGGSFQMGSPSGETGRDSDERQHAVEVGDFYIGQTEVTVGEFKRFVEATGHKTDAERNAGGEQGCFSEAGTSGNFSYQAGRSWRNPGFSQTAQHPVVCVSHNDAQAYVEWLSEQTGQTYRLPTEAQWEYAARAGTRTARYWGNDKASACSHANGADRAAKRQHPDWTTFDCDDGYVNTAPVETFRPNAWNLYDMLGNVWEWTSSAYQENYAGAETLPVDSAEKFAERGGGWSSKPAWVRSAPRFWSFPTYRFDYLGFRLSRTR